MKVIGPYSISPLTLGTVSLGIPYVFFDKQDSVDKEAGKLLLKDAIELGIRCFDTAREYGIAEEIIGETMQEQSNLVVISKFKWTKEACLDKHLAEKEAYQSVYESLQKLNLKTLPICLFHMVSAFDILKVQNILPDIMMKMKAEGLIHYAGVSLDEPLEIQYFLESPVFDVFQIPINVFDQRLYKSELWQKLVEADKIIFVRSVFLKGLLLQDPALLTGNLVDAKPYLSELKRLASQLDMSVAQFCFSYVRDLLGVSSLIIGAEKKNQLIENAKLLEGKEIPSSVREEAFRLFNDIPKHIITPRLWKA